MSLSANAPTARGFIDRLSDYRQNQWQCITNLRTFIGRIEGSPDQAKVSPEKPAAHSMPNIVNDLEEANLELNALLEKLATMF